MSLRRDLDGRISIGGWGYRLCLGRVVGFVVEGGCWRKGMQDDVECERVGCARMGSLMRRRGCSWVVFRCFGHSYDACRDHLIWQRWKPLETGCLQVYGAELGSELERWYWH